MKRLPSPVITRKLAPKLIRGGSPAIEDLRGFDLWLRSGGYRADTIERATRVARQYLASTDGADSASSEAVRAFLAAAGERVKRVTLLNYHKDLAMFFRFAMSAGLVDSNPLDQIPKPRPSLDERERDTRFLPYTETDFRSLLDATPYWSWIGLRDRSLLWVLWDTPLRAGEICGLLVTDVDWQAMELRVRDGKGGVRYEAVMSNDCGLALDSYLRARPADVAALFIDRHGGMLSRHALEQLLRRLAKRTGLKKPCSPHYWRHSFRVRMRMLGLDDAAISALMGHRSVVVTHSYARHVARQMAKAQLRERLAS